MATCAANLKGGYTMKFRKHISGLKDKNGKGYVSGYDARIPAQVLKDAGFIKEDGTPCEYEAVASYSDKGNQMVIELRKKESEA